MPFPATFHGTRLLQCHESLPINFDAIVTAVSESCPNQVLTSGCTMTVVIQQKLIFQLQGCLHHCLTSLGRVSSRAIPDAEGM